MHDAGGRSDAEVKWREEFQKAVEKRLLAKGWPPIWALTLAGECLLALDERGFDLIPPMDLDPVALRLGFAGGQPDE